MHAEHVFIVNSIINIVDGFSCSGQPSPGVPQESHDEKLEDRFTSVNVGL